MKTALLCLFAIVSLVGASAQNHDHVWLFGYGSQSPNPGFGGTVIDFNTIPPDIFYQYNEMNFDITDASMSDINGELQFYTNGIYVANKEYQVMANGANINPGQYADEHADYGYFLNQGAFAVPHPDGSNRYFLIHADKRYPTEQVDWNSKYLYYSLIDMNLESELGKIVAKNQVIINDTLTTGHLTAVRHANGRDWWMIEHEMSSKDYHRVLITPEGIDNVGMASTSFSIPEEGIGQSVFSSDGSVFARMNAYNFDNGQQIEIYKFDRCSGYLTEQLKILYDDDAYTAGIAISPNSRFLYVPSFGNLYQFDLQAADIIGSKQTIHYDGFTENGASTGFFLAQLAPDGKIYISASNTVHYLHVIHQPNLPYPDCMVEQHGITLPTYNSFSMPNFPNYRLGPLDGSPCDTLGLDNHPIAKFRYDQDTTDYLSVRFTDLSYYEPAEWSWDFGDPTGAGGGVSQDTSPVHAYPSDGTYEVCLTVSNQYSSNTFCRILIIGTGISATQEAAVSDIVSVFPNPAQSATNFRIGEDYLPRQAMLTLYTATGQPILTQRLTAGWSVVQLESVAPGMYFWEVKDSEKVLGTGKLVKVE
jgi:PKD repeat protein